MRPNLLDLIEKTIIYKFDLPNNSIGVQKTILSTKSDKCYSVQENNNLVKIIYNSLIDYSFNEFELENKDYQAMHTKALLTKIKFDTYANETTKIKYGFFGEVLLYSILMVKFNTKLLIARGHFYNPLENSETKGYDSYHLIENDGITELWFGEAKFHAEHKAWIKSIIGNLSKVLSDKYLNKNFLAIHGRKNDLNIKGSQIENILEAWDIDPTINIITEIKKFNMKLVYPILLLYEEDPLDYNASISKAVEHIKNTCSVWTPSLSIDYSIFFIFLPLKKVKEIKTQVIQWIDSKEPPML